MCGGGLSILSRDLSPFLLTFLGIWDCGLRIFIALLRNADISAKLILVAKNHRFDAHSVKILCNTYLKALKQTKTIRITKI